MFLPGCIVAKLIEVKAFNFLGAAKYTKKIKLYNYDFKVTFLKHLIFCAFNSWLKGTHYLF